MAAWIPVPEPLTWQLPEGVREGGMVYREIVLRAPTGADIMKATAIPGSSPQEVTLRLIEAVSGVPYEVIKRLGWHEIVQMRDYMDEFAGAPAPDPLEAWRKARRLALEAEVKAALANGDGQGEVIPVS